MTSIALCVDFALCRYLYEGNQDGAMRVALLLREYEDMLKAQEIYSLLALTSFYNKYYNQCSKAFMKLESLPNISEHDRQAYVHFPLSLSLSLSLSLLSFSVNEVRRPGSARKKRPNDGKREGENVLTDPTPFLWLSCLTCYCTQVL